MNHFALTCPQGENMKLFSLINYSKWYNNTYMLAAVQGAGLDVFFTSGDMMLSEAETADDSLVLNL